MTEIYSHKLEAGDYLPWLSHAQHTADHALAIVCSKQFDFPSYEREDVLDAVHLCALFHDIGKGTKYFQIYLKTPHRQDLSQAFLKAGLLSNGRLKDHSLLSSLCAYAIALDSFKDKPDKIKDELTMAIFLACASHHGSLKSQGWVSETLSDGVDDGGLDDIAEMYRALGPQMFSLQFQTISGSDRQFATHVCARLDIQDIIKEVRRKFTKVAVTQTTFEFNILTMFLYSILLESDKFWLVTKEDASMLTPYSLDEQSVDMYRSQKFVTAPKTQINDMRNATYTEVEDTLAALSSQDIQTGAFWTLNLPTGMGKTLTLANVGLKIARRMADSGMRPKIIVALPFLSVIEQSHEEYAEILGNNNILKYHSLSDLGVGTMADGTDRDTIKFLADIWDKPFIVTTFDQLLYAFLSEKKAFASRFHNLFNSVVLLDEIQGVPYKAWTTFADFVNLLCRIGKSHFVVSSATCPDFNVPATRHLINEPQRYYRKLKRTTIRVDKLDTAIEESELTDFLMNQLSDYADRSLLVILNTVSSAQKIYGELIKHSERRIYSLTAALLPTHRAAVIAQIKEDIERKKYPVLIATQTVEAGVDLDFDITVRDIAPLDSIIQAAGRTNRNWLSAMGGTVHLVCVKSHGRWHAHSVYGRNSGGQSAEVAVTFDMFNRHKPKELSEQEYFDLVTRYFNWLQEQAKNDSDATSLNYALKKMSFDLQTKTIKQMLRGEDEKERVFIVHDRISGDLIERVRTTWKSVQGERYKINKWELALLDARGSLAENTIGLYKWQIRALPLNYIDPSRELFSYIDISSTDGIYQFDDQKVTGIGLSYKACKSKYDHTCIV